MEKVSAAEQMEDEEDEDSDSTVENIRTVPEVKLQEQHESVQTHTSHLLNNFLHYTLFCSLLI